MKNLRRILRPNLGFASFCVITNDVGRKAISITLLTCIMRLKTRIEGMIFHSHYGWFD